METVNVLKELVNTTTTCYKLEKENESRICVSTGKHMVELLPNGTWISFYNKEEKWISTLDRKQDPIDPEMCELINEIPKGLTFYPICPQPLNKGGIFFTIFKDKEYDFLVFEDGNWDYNVK